MRPAQRRLLSLNSYHYRRGGSDVVYLEHDALFNELGWETAVMSMHHPRNLPSPWSRYFVDELEFGQTSGLVDKVVKASKVVFLKFDASGKFLSKRVPAKLKAYGRLRAVTALPNGDLLITTDNGNNQDAVLRVRPL